MPLLLRRPRGLVRPSTAATVDGGNSLGQALVGAIVVGADYGIQDLVHPIVPPAKTTNWAYADTPSLTSAGSPSPLWKTWPGTRAIRTGGSSTVNGASLGVRKDWEFLATDAWTVHIRVTAPASLATNAIIPLISRFNGNGTVTTTSMSWALTWQISTSQTFAAFAMTNGTSTTQVASTGVSAQAGLGTWHDLTAVVTPTATTLYRNGVQVATGTGGLTILSTANPFYLGEVTNVTSANLAVSISHAYVWKRALPRDEIMRLMAEPFAPVAPSVPFPFWTDNPPVLVFPSAATGTGLSLKPAANPGVQPPAVTATGQARDVPGITMKVGQSNLVAASPTVYMVAGIDSDFPHRVVAAGSPTATATSLTVIPSTFVYPPSAAATALARTVTGTDGVISARVVEGGLGAAQARAWMIGALSGIIPRTATGTGAANTVTSFLTSSTPQVAQVVASANDSVGRLQRVIPSLSIAVLDGPPTPASPSAPIATLPGQVTDYTVVVVDIYGQRFAEFPEATVTSITWELNAPGEAVFTIPVDTANIGEIALANASTTPHREVQIWRNGALLWWGIPLKRRVTGSAREYEYTAAGLLWYFTRRYVGDADRTNHLSNPQAEDGMNGWTAVNCSATTTADQHVLGDQSFRLTAFGNPGGYIYQQQLIHAGPIGLALFAAGWVYRPSPVGGPFIPADHAYGLVLLRLDAVTGQIKKFAQFDTLNDRAPADKWSRQGSVVNIPPNTTEIIEVRLYAPKMNPPSGYVYWDALQLVTMESLAFFAVPPNTVPPDQVDIAKGTIDYAQGKGKGAGNSKSDLNIGTTGPASGIHETRVYQHADHQRIYTGSSGGSGCLDEWPAKTNGFDFAIEVSEAGVRHFTTYYPRQGIFRGDKGLAYGRNIADYSIEEDVSAAADQIVILGETNNDSKAPTDAGAAREEGGYSKPSALGGLTLELVESAPTGAPIGQLDALAKSYGARIDNAITVPSLTVYEPRDPVTNEVTVQMIGDLDVGDVVPVQIIDGTVVLNGTYRIVRIVLDPSTELLTLDLNPETVGLPIATPPTVPSLPSSVPPVRVGNPGSAPTPTSPIPPPDPASFPGPVPDPAPVGVTGPLGSTGAFALIFSDEFDSGSLDRTKWATFSGAEGDGGRGNLGNQQLEYNTDGNNLTFGASVMTIHPRRETIQAPSGQTYNWTSSFVTSQQGFSVAWIEENSKLPSLKGFWPAFWTWGAPGTNAPQNEVDVYEFYSDNHSLLYLTAHVPSGGAQSVVSRGFDPSAAFHTYGADIRTNGIDWYIDGVLVKSVAGHPPELWNIICNCFVYSVIPPDPGTTGEAKAIDWIRVWSRS